jgi:hypothetical protein
MEQNVKTDEVREAPQTEKPEAPRLRLELLEERIAPLALWAD